MTRAVDKPDKEASTPVNTLPQLERLASVRKRKQAFGGQIVSREAVLQRLQAERRRRQQR
jgi:hypothetical protein